MNAYSQPAAPETSIFEDSWTQFFGVLAIVSGVLSAYYLWSARPPVEPTQSSAAVSPVQPSAVRWLAGPAPSSDGRVHTLQDALENARSGEVIELRPGEYHANLTASKTIMLLEDGPPRSSRH